MQTGVVNVAVGMIRVLDPIGEMADGQAAKVRQKSPCRER